MDPTFEQWKQIADVVKQNQLVPFLDIAYQGFGDGLQEDAAVVRMFAEQDLTMFISSSFSKSFAVWRTRRRPDRGGRQQGRAARAEPAQARHPHNYSNPPTHGGTVVSTVLNSPELFSCGRRARRHATASA